MSLTVISYRANYDRTCGRSCNCSEGGNDSSLEVLVVADIPEAAAFITKRMLEDEHASFEHVVIDNRNGSRPVDIGAGNSYGPGIEMLNPDEGFVTQAELNAHVTELLTKERQRMAEAKAAREQRQREAAKAAVRKRDLEELARLTKKLENS
jgi:hypothetical protein